MQEENVWGLDLTHYGPCLSLYKGNGTLTLGNGEKVECAFEAGQLVSGDVILLCASGSPSLFGFDISVSAFSGTTAEGYVLSASDRITEMNYLPDRPRGQSGAWVAFRLNSLTVRVHTEGQVRRVCFGITNFKFIPIARIKGGNNQDLSILPLRLESGEGGINLFFRPIEQYDKVMQRVQTLKGIGVTCEAVADVSADSDIKRLEEVIDSLCRILSVARGTKIQWIYGDYYGEDGNCIRRVHFGHITKPYCPMAIIDPRHQGRNETQSFIEGAYRVYAARRDTYKLDKGTIDAYLDAKAENDYLEVRGAKLAVALEKLKAVFVTRPGSTVREFVLDEEIFNGLLPNIKDAVGNVLKEAGVAGSLRGEIYGKLRGLNRRSFADLLTGFFGEIGLSPSNADIQLFIQCRNKLVHAGEFYSVAATTEERAKCSPLSSPVKEYYFMVNLLDQIFLRLLGYSGPYIDYNTLIPGPLRRGVVIDSGARTNS